ncbi:PQQ-binding-like beta-propeller repeat protein [Tamaricihabitans halophyticus]|uniref:outer membrane protein assembly factor BamB family protein n=1 Tax=Tamaricihabitans halophyticus TaxID=1262583 RepID=UPI001404CE96|nr:PQQ-binding-like beta-propeller repeat protein [Tamaricihabitans halophyticus]
MASLLIVAGCSAPEQDTVAAQQTDFRAQWTLAQDPVRFTEYPTLRGTGRADVVGDVVFSSDIDGVRAVDGRNGRGLWRSSELEERRGVDGFAPPVPGSSPVLLGRNEPVVFTGWSDPKNKVGVAALRGSTGEPWWQGELDGNVPKDATAAASLVVAASSAGVAVRVYDAVAEVSYASVMLDSTTGETIWREPDFGAAGATDEVVLGKRAVPNARYAALDAETGEPRWTLPRTVGNHDWSTSETRLVYANQQTAVFASAESFSVVVDIGTGEVREVRPVGGGCVGQGDRLAVCGLAERDGKPYAPFGLDPSTGAQVPLDKVRKALGPDGTVTGATDTHVYGAAADGAGRVFDLGTGEQQGEDLPVPMRAVGNGFGISQDTPLSAWQIYPALNPN